MKLDMARASRCNSAIFRYTSLLSRKSDIQVAVRLISDFCYVSVVNMMNVYTSTEFLNVWKCG
jgi:hypothetical protein